MVSKAFYDVIIKIMVERELECIISMELVGRFVGMGM